MDIASSSGVWHDNTKTTPVGTVDVEALETIIEISTKGV
jgi:hypothetical protein